jgi:hypothetical protein
MTTLIPVDTFLAAREEKPTNSVTPTRLETRHEIMGVLHSTTDSSAVERIYTSGIEPLYCLPRYNLS